ncbi:MAG: hypothetical protein EOO88_28815 [Pedobacter sp.]|nr:MAG: hypothetical protein EOO88_28815 [Pedobacter sp.]
MARTLPPFIRILLFGILCAYSIHVRAQVTAPSILVDDEYDLYRKRADDSFCEGNYAQALRQYHNCLGVPGFETDLYAKQQIIKSTTCSNLRKQVEAALKHGKRTEAIGLFDKLLKYNPDDIHTRDQVVDDLDTLGNGLSSDKKYVDARLAYEKAIKYATGQRRDGLLTELTNVNTLRSTSLRLKLQMATGVIAVGTTVYALVLRNDYLTKRNALDQISNGAENAALPGTIDNADIYSKYKEAYIATQSAEKKKGWYIASVGVAAIAALAEVYLLRNPPKRTNKKLTWKPSSQSLGLAVSYTF